MNNKGIIRHIFKIIENTYSYFNIHITSKSYGDGYYIFDMGKDSVCHFKVSGIKKWLFAIWVQPVKDSDKYQFDLFGQHTDYIDKFKPSCSPISFSFECTIDELDDNLDIYSFSEKICELIHAPISRKFQYYGGNECLLHFVIEQFWYYRIIRPINKFIDNKLVKVYLNFLKVLFTLFFKRKNNNYHIEIKETKNCLPRYEFFMIYDKCDDDFIYDVYHWLEIEKNGRRKFKFVPKWVHQNCSLTHSRSDKDKRGFYYE